MHLLSPALDEVPDGVKYALISYIKPVILRMFQPAGQLVHKPPETEV